MAFASATPASTSTAPSRRRGDAERALDELLAVDGHELDQAHGDGNRAELADAHLDLLTRFIKVLPMNTGTDFLIPQRHSPTDP